jgi:hypothetical protein
VLPPAEPDPPVKAAPNIHERHFHPHVALRLHGPLGACWETGEDRHRLAIACTDGYLGYGNGTFPLMP